MKPFTQQLLALSVRAKLTAVVMITTCTALVLAGGTLTVFEVSSHKASLRRELTTMADILGENSAATLTFENPEDAARILGALKSQPDVQSGCLYDAQGKLFAHFVASKADAFCPEEARADAAGFIGDTLVLHEPVAFAGVVLGSIRLTASLAPLDRRVRLFGVVVLLVMTGSALIALALSRRLQRVISRPILALGATARRVSDERDYALRAPQESRDEVGTAIAAFNQMLERVERADAELRSLNANLEQRVAERTAAAEERAAALRKSNEELERFAAVASHDLQEPLRAIASYAQLVEQHTSGKLGAEVDLYLRHIRRGVGRMRDLIQDLLAYARVGRDSIQRSTVDTGALLDEVLADLAAPLAESGATVVRGVLPELRADRGQLAQVFQNLISNALRFRGEAPPRIEIAADRDTDGWRFLVRDNGLGIDPRHHERIFVIFQRLHGRDRPGTGMGLSICRRIVERHGGRIWVESTPGAGATFVFTLPTAARKAVEEVA